MLGVLAAVVVSVAVGVFVVMAVLVAAGEFVMVGIRVTVGVLVVAALGNISLRVWVQEPRRTQLW